MKTIESIAFATVRLFEAVDLLFLINPFGARQILLFGPKNSLCVAKLCSASFLCPSIQNLIRAEYM